MERILSAADAAKVVGVSKTTMAEWCERGYVPKAQKVSRFWAIPESSIELINKPRMGRPRKKKEYHTENDNTKQA